MVMTFEMSSVNMIENKEILDILAFLIPHLYQDYTERAIKFVFKLAPCPNNFGFFYLNERVYDELNEFCL